VTPEPTGERRFKYGVRGPDPRNTVVAFPDLASAKDARTSDEVVVISRNGGKDWSTLDQDRINQSCGCCGPLDLGPCTCVTYCGVIRCSQVSDNSTRRFRSPLDVHLRHLPTTDGGCRCGFAPRTGMQRARHLTEALIDAGFVITYPDGYTGDPVDLKDGTEQSQDPVEKALRVLDDRLGVLEAAADGDDLRGRIAGLREAREIVERARQ